VRQAAFQAGQERSSCSHFRRLRGSAAHSNRLSYASSPQAAVIGALLGLGTAILLGWSLFASIVRLDLQRFFQVTGFLLILFAAGLVAHGVHEFNELGWIPPIIEHLWDLNRPGRKFFARHAADGLFGYNANPP
jgi:high-affinity iron transporter